MKIERFHARFAGTVRHASNLHPQETPDGAKDWVSAQDMIYNYGDSLLNPQSADPHSRRAAIMGE